MANESRVKKTLLNARVNLIFYFLTLVLSFFSRKIFLDCLGADFVGLTGTLQNLLGFLNLAELGIGGAIGYLLYKPLFDHDETKINEIISVMGYLYRWIGFIIIAAGCILSCFLPLIFPDDETGFHLPLIYFAYFSFLGSSLIGYFINYRQNLLGADQKNYVVTAYFQTANILKVIVQLILAYYSGNYYLWVIVEFVFSIIYSIILNWKINQTYPWLKADVQLGRKVFKKYPEVMVKTKQLFVHKISAFVQFQTAPFLVYAFVSLKTVAYYGNYTLIFDKINILLANLTGSVTAGVGNLIAEGNRNKIVGVFWELMSARFFLAGIIIFGFYNFMNPFITLWLGSKYVLESTILYVLIINFFISFSRSATDPFLFGYGLFNDTWAPVTETVIYLLVSIVAGHYLGLVGVILGTTVSTGLIICCWKPTFLFSRGLKLPVLKYWGKWLLMLLLTVVSIIACSNLLNAILNVDSYKFNGFIISLIVKTIVFSLVLFTLFYLSFSHFRLFIKRFMKKSNK